MFLSKGLANAQSILIGTSPICGDTIAPGFSLSIKIFQIDEFAGSEKAQAYESDGPFDFAFFVAPGYGHRAWLVAVVPGEVQQGRMKADRVAATFDHGAFKIIVQQDPRDAAPSREGTNMSAQEIFHASVQEEAQINRPRIAQHHDEGQQWPARAADHQ